MAHEFRLWMDVNADIETIQNKLNSRSVRKAIILPDRAYPLQKRTSYEGTEYMYGHYYIDERLDINNIYDAVESQNLQDYVNWGLVKYRQSTVEYDHGPQSWDGDYYRPGLNTGLRDDPNIRKTDHLECRLGGVEYRINGTDYSSDYQTIKFDGHETTKRKARIVVDVDGLKVLNGDPSIDPIAPSEPTDSITIAIITLYPSEIISIEEKTQAMQYTTTDWQEKYNIGTVPTEFE